MQKQHPVSMGVAPAGIQLQASTSGCMDDLDKIFGWGEDMWEQRVRTAGCLNITSWIVQFDALLDWTRVSGGGIRLIARLTYFRDAKLNGQKYAWICKPYTAPNSSDVLRKCLSAHAMTALLTLAPPRLATSTVPSVLPPSTTSTSLGGLVQLKTLRQRAATGVQMGASAGTHAASRARSPLQC